MASELKQWCMVCAVVVVLSWGCWVEADPQVPCYFIFGDSLVDNGNNNGIASLARANYLPYGIDFPQGPTGRFSNGKTTVDVIGELSISIFLTSYFCMQLVHICVYVRLLIFFQSHHWLVIEHTVSMVMNTLFSPGELSSLEGCAMLLIL